VAGRAGGGGNAKKLSQWGEGGKKERQEASKIEVRKLTVFLAAVNVRRVGNEARLLLFG
jgi:hypothetical protein